MEEDSYLTLENESEGEFKDRGSKFFAYISPMSSIDEFNELLKFTKDKHFKARHHCFAYRMKDEALFRYSDDGEPSGTAGKPIYNQFLSNQIVDIGCVVVRYFGGTKLGTSGLINAYKEATKDAIKNNVIIRKYITRRIELAFDYGIMGSIMNTLKKLNLDDVMTPDFGHSPKITLEVNRSKVENTIFRIKAHMLNRSIEDVDHKTEIEGVTFTY